MPRNIGNVVSLMIMGLLLAAPRGAVACSVCMGRADDAATQGLNAAVLTLLTALLLVIGAVVGFIACLARRAIKRPLALPGMPGGVVR